MIDRKQVRVLCVLLAGAFSLCAGCVTKPTSDPLPDPRPAAPNVIAVANNATGCSRVFPAIFVDRAHAQSFLPQGFVAAESSQFFGQSSVPAGRAVLIVSMMRCSGSEWTRGPYAEAMAGLFVDPPRVNGSLVKGEHFYELGRSLGSNAPGATLRGLDWHRIGETVSVAYAGEPTRGASASIRDGNGTVFSATLPGAGMKDSFTATLHLLWWHQTPTGLASHEYTFRPDGYLGTGSCDARPGSLVAEVLASTPCTPLFMVGPPFDVRGRFEHRSGVQAQR